MNDLILKDKFRENYNKSNIQSGNTVWAKGLLISPLFSSSVNVPSIVTETDADIVKDLAGRVQHLGFKNLKNTSKDAIVVELEKDDLKGTQYNRMYFYGFPLNSEMQFEFLNYVVERLLAQLNEPTYKNDPSLVIIDIDSMIYKLGLNPKLKSFYKDAYLDMNNRLNHSYTRYEMSNGVTVNDSYVYKFSYNEDKSLFETKFGDVFLESIAYDTWRKKINYRNLMELKGGTARLLYNYIDSLELKGSATININTVIKTLGLDGVRKSKIKVLNRAIDYLIEIGFIDNEIEEEKYKREVVEKTFKIKREFDLAEFARKERENAASFVQLKRVTKKVKILPEVPDEKPEDKIGIDVKVKMLEDDWNNKKWMIN